MAGLPLFADFDRYEEMGWVSRRQDSVRSAVEIGLSGFAIAAGKEARVTQAVHDVRLLASNSATRPASVGDNVRPGTAVRTASDSRAELTFTDRTLARLGANSALGFGEGREFDLRNGSILLYPAKRFRSRQNRHGSCDSGRYGFHIDGRVSSQGHGSNSLSSKVTAASLSNIMPARVDHSTQDK